VRQSHPSRRLVIAVTFACDGSSCSLFLQIYNDPVPFNSLLEASSWHRSTESLSHPTDRKIEYSNGKYRVPDHPIIPFIEGDGTGRDIWKASVRVFDAAVEKAYNGKRSVSWYEVFAGEKAKARFRTGCPTTPSAPSANFASPSKAR
jgi:hypothetical protein